MELAEAVHYVRQHIEYARREIGDAHTNSW
jgi:hypothetical protein